MTRIVGSAGNACPQGSGPHAPLGKGPINELVIDLTTNSH